MSAPSPEVVREIREMLLVSTQAEVAAHFGVSKTTLVRWLNPDYAARSRALSLAAKQRRRGACIDCGAETRYNGRASMIVSLRCPACATVVNAAAAKVWTRDRIITAIQEWAAEFGEPPAMKDWNSYETTRHGDHVRAARFKEGHAAGRWPWFHVAYREFGSWGAALIEAGFTPRPAGGGGENAKRRRKTMMPVFPK